MAAQSYSRGSEWRVWDLHFHTQSSYDYQDKSIENGAIVDKLVAQGVSVVGITDHHVIDIDRISELQKIAAGRLTVLPGIELRTELGGSSLVHMIGIFAEDADLADNWTHLQAKLCITEKDLREKGDDGVYVDFKASADLIHALGGIVTVHAGRKSNTIEEISSLELYKRLLKTDLLRDYVDILEIGQYRDIELYQKTVFPSIQFERPLCLFSDNHNINEYVVKEKCWIKADPTFRGLKQLLIEPRERVFIGDLPESLHREQAEPTRIIDAITVAKKAESQLAEHWFELDCELSSELIAVIGNKGSGKSALADIVGLAGGTKRSESFSFLREDRFRKARDNKAMHFTASLTWHDGTSDVVASLAEDPEETAVEKVRYIPQNYLEQLCNELTDGPDSKFHREIEEVIFTHIDQADRLGHDSLRELLAFRASETNKAIEQFEEKILEINKEIVVLEGRLQPSFRESLQRKIAEKERELRAHEAAVPSVPGKPDEREDVQAASKAIQAEITILQEAFSSATTELNKLNKEDAEIAKKLASVDSLVRRITNLRRYLDQFRLDSVADLDVIGVSFDDVIKIAVDEGAIRNLEIELNARRLELNKTRDKDEPDSVAAMVDGLVRSIAERSAELSKPQQEYQKALELRKDWEHRRAKIIGNSELVDSLEYLRGALTALDALPEELSALLARRSEVAAELFSEKLKIKGYYENYYGRVQKFISSHHLNASQWFAMEFDVSISAPDLEEALLGMIHRGRSGPFMGQDGELELRRQLDSAVFDTTAGVLAFAESVVGKMKGESKNASVSSQLRNGIKLEDFYTYLFSFGYCSPQYSLKWDGKRLDQLSPGERGNLLLIFYLIVDRQNIPIVIDQPEENLDNQTVVNTLVPCVKDAKKRRQIVMVTHNPNLAVVCDAEQVVYARIDKEDGNRVTYTSGSIENPAINALIVEVLEGTQPAFDKRGAKYQVQ